LILLINGCMKTQNNFLRYKRFYIMGNIKMSKTYKALYEIIEGQQIINTHSHHLSDDKFTGLTLYDVLNMSYISWISPPFENNEAGRRTFIERISCNTYFIWLAKSLGILYGNGEALNIANWSLIDDNLRGAHADKDYHMKILTGKCNYKRSYWISMTIRVPITVIPI